MMTVELDNLVTTCMHMFQKSNKISVIFIQNFNLRNEFLKLENCLQRTSKYRIL